MRGLRGSATGSMLQGIATEDRSAAGRGACLQTHAQHRVVRGGNRAPGKKLNTGPTGDMLKEGCIRCWCVNYQERT